MRMSLASKPTFSLYFSSLNISCKSKKHYVMMSLEKHYVMRSLVSWVMWWGALKSIMWWWALKSIMWRGALWVELCDEEPCELSYVMRSLVSWVMWWGALKSIMWWWALKSSGALLRKAAVIYTEKQRCFTQESSSDLHRAIFTISLQ